jgi:hypothetical protein
VELPISPLIFEKNRNVRLGGRGFTKKLEAKNLAELSL